MTLKKTCACGKCNQESDSVGNFKNQKTDQEKIIDKTREQAKQEEREKLKEQFDEEKAFPKDIFPELTKKQLADINVFMINHLGFPLDRLSAHIGRKHYKNIKQEIENV